MGRSMHVHPVSSDDPAADQIANDRTYGAVMTWKRTNYLELLAPRGWLVPRIRPNMKALSIVPVCPSTRNHSKVCTVGEVEDGGQFPTTGRTPCIPVSQTTRKIVTPVSATSTLTGGSISRISLFISVRLVSILDSTGLCIDMSISAL